MKNKLIVLVLVVLVFVSGCTKKEMIDFEESTIQSGQVISQDVLANIEDAKLNILDESRRHEIKVNTAIDISNRIKELNLREIDLKEIETYEDYVEMADRINLAIKIINEKIGSDFKLLGNAPESYDKFMMEVTRYSPLIDNYNEFIVSCYNLDPANDDSVNNLYIEGITFAGEATLIIGGAFYGTAFEITGTLARTSGLTKMTTICGSCVSAAMSSIHWYIRNYLTETASATIEKTLSGEYNRTTIDSVKERIGKFFS